jgi:hypothetical protein
MREKTMENLFISGTTNSPEMDFKMDGQFKMKGRIITDNAITTFEPLFSWIENFDGNNVVFDVDLDYINTSATMQLFAFLRILDENCAIEKVIVRWYYDSDDEDHLETGEFYCDKLKRINFEYVQSAERQVA